MKHFAPHAFIYIGGSIYTVKSTSKSNTVGYWQFYLTQLGGRTYRWGLGCWSILILCLPLSASPARVSLRAYVSRYSPWVTFLASSLSSIRAFRINIRNVIRYINIFFHVDPHLYVVYTPLYPFIKFINNNIIVINRWIILLLSTSTLDLSVS